jgi:hypothetical protein
MNFLKKNKVLVIIVSLLLLAGVVTAVLLGNATSSPSTDDSGNILETPVKVISADEIGLTLSFRADKKAINMSITKLDGIEAVEYEVTYDANVTADSSGDSASGITQRGVVGSPIPVNGASSIKRSIDLGTCSKNVCKYDAVVSDVKFVIKVTYSNGEIGSVEESISL